MGELLFFGYRLLSTSFFNNVAMKPCLLIIVMGVKIPGKAGKNEYHDSFKGEFHRSIWYL